MEEDFFEDLPEEEKIKIENEIKKLKIEMAGGKIITGPNSLNLPPDVESVFLDNILEFESKLKNKKEITIRELLNYPELKEESDMVDFELEVELEEFMSHLNDKNIRLITIYDVEKRKLYQFIKNEFLDKKTIDLGIPGLMCQFIYEEFHPNHEENIKEYCLEFFEDFCNTSDDDFSDYFDKNPELQSKFKLFREAYEHIELEKFDLVSIKVLKRSAKATFDVTLSCKIGGVSESHSFSGKTTFSLSLKNKKHWEIKSIKLPLKGF